MLLFPQGDEIYEGIEEEVPSLCRPMLLMWYVSSLSALVGGVTNLHLWPMIAAVGLMVLFGAHWPPRGVSLDPSRGALVQGRL